MIALNDGRFPTPNLSLKGTQLDPSEQHSLKWPDGWVGRFNKWVLTLPGNARYLSGGER